MFSKNINKFGTEWIIVILIVCLCSLAFAGQWPSFMDVYKGSTPTLDGELSPGEWDDAVSFTHHMEWTPQFNRVSDLKDLSLTGYAKHDGKNLYFAFDVTDDVIYGIDTERWLPDENPKAHDFSRESFPWFGDGIELLINPSYQWAQKDQEYNSGSGKSWQMVCNTTKSLKGGIGKGGLIQGEERSMPKSWKNYTKWIKQGAQDAVVKIKSNGKGYVIEWKIEANPCLEVEDRKFWDPSMGEVKMGLNIGVQDLDEKHKGEGNFGNFNHEDWWAGEKDKRTWLKQWGTMTVHPGPKPTEIAFVSPNGSDNNPGTKEKPFATIKKVQQKVRQMNEDMSSDMIVYLREGTYTITDPIKFTEADSGTNGFQVIYKAYKGEKVIISSGKTITGWKKADDPQKKNLRVAPVEGVDMTRQFYINGKRATLARGDIIEPKGWIYADRPNMELYKELERVDSFRNNMPVYAGYKVTGEMMDIKNWRNPGDIAFVYTTGWTHCIFTIDEITPIEGEDALFIKMGGRGFRDAQLKDGMQIKDPSYIENAYELLDEPGEWYMDRSKKKIYYIPKAGEDMTTAETVVPVVDQLLVIDGTIDKPVKNIGFEDLEFAYTTFLRPMGLGHAEIQANVLKGPDVDIDHMSYIMTPSGVRVIYGHNIHFEKCYFHKMGAGALDIYRGSKNCLVRGCRFEEIAATAIQVGEVQLEDAHPDDPRMIVKDNTITNNLITNIGTEFKGSCGIFCGYVDGTIITHNELSYIGYTGISVGWGWGFWDDWKKPDVPRHYHMGKYPRFNKPTVCRNNIVAYNHIHHVLQQLHDGGGIYTLSKQPGTVIKFNHVHDNGGKSGWPGGIYLDEASSHMEVTGNIVYNVSKPFHIHWTMPVQQSTLKVYDNFFGIKPLDAIGLEPVYRKLLEKKK